MDHQTKTLDQLIRNVMQQPSGDERVALKSRRNTTIDAELKRAMKIKNNNAVSDQKMKEKALRWLFIVMAIEVGMIFLLAVLQGFGSCGGWFHIEEWCFALLVSGIFVHTAAMVAVAVTHLFPAKG